jgi:hypothetical protein
MSEVSHFPSAYGDIHTDIVALLENARRAAARSVNALMTASYWEIGRRIVEFEQGGEDRAAYGDALIQRLALDLSNRFGRGFSYRNLSQMRAFYLAWPMDNIRQTVSGISSQITQTLSAQSYVPSILQTVSAESSSTPIIQTAFGQLLTLTTLAEAFPLPWSAYVRLLSVKKPEARGFYETEALRCGWTVRQLDRQINSQFYERTALSKNKVAMLKQAEQAESGDLITPEEAIKDPFVLEFLNLKDQYSESDL